MNKRSSSKTSKTDWTRVRAMKDGDIIFSAEHPEADVRHIARGIVRRGLKPLRVTQSAPGSRKKDR